MILASEQIRPFCVIFGCLRPHPMPRRTAVLELSLITVFVT